MSVATVSQKLISTADRQRLQAAILDHAAYAIIAARPDGVITEFNRAAEALLGYAAEEVIGRMTPEPFHLPEEVEARAKALSEELGEQISPGFDVFVIQCRAGGSLEQEWTYVRRDGGHVPVLLSITALFDEDGSITGYLGIAKDISERKLAEAVLRESEQKLRNLFTLSPIGIALADMSGRFIDVNDAFLDICGYTREELYQLDYWALTPPNYMDAEAEQLKSLSVNGRYGPYEKHYIKKSGDLSPVRLRGTLIRGSDGVQYIWSLVEDISEQRQTEQTLIEARIRAEEANRAKSDFLANVSHELRTPLNGVIALADTLLKTDLSPHQRELVQIICSSGVSLEGLLSQILDLSKVESGGFTPTKAPFDLAAHVQQAAEVHRGKAESQGLRLMLEVAPRAEGWFLGDAGGLKQIVANLVSNAVKFTEQGWVTVSIDAEEVDGGGSAVTITVADSGIGIDPAALPRLFERFTQADESITRRFGGTGLGLAISKQLAELMGGALTVRSALGHGSQFSVTLPLSRTQPIEPNVCDATGDPDLDALRVLLAEDHPVNRRVVELLLEPLGVTLTAAVDGQEAFDLFASQTFDLVLMDMQMPRMDGLGATRAIRALEALKKTPRVPVIMLTANSFDHHKALALEAGADAFLAKPLTVSILLETITELMQDR